MDPQTVAAENMKAEGSATSQHTACLLRGYAGTWRRCRLCSLSEIALSTSRKIGEADNPGPYIVGGTASSGQAAPPHSRQPTGRSGWTLEGHGRWSPSQPTDAAEMDVLQEQWRWPIPVVCRDVTFLHQFETRFMHCGNLVPFLQDELYGLDCIPQQLEETLDAIYAFGRGGFDPATLVDRDSWLNGCEQYGWADALEA